MKYTLIIFLAIKQLVYAHQCSHDSRVIGGEKADRRQFPYMATIYRGGKQGCGGSVLSQTWVISAAHCYMNNIPAGSLSVVAGLLVHGENHPDNQRSPVKRYVNYPDYESKRIGDLSLLELQTPFAFNDAVQPLVLPTAGQEISGRAMLTGWGLTNFPGTLARHLKFLEMQLVDYKRCTEIINNIGELIVNLTEAHICSLPDAPKQSACFGDSGGPLVQNEVLVGIASSVSSRSCGQSLSVAAPTVYARTGAFISFIKNVTNLS